MLPMQGASLKGIGKATEKQARRAGCNPSQSSDGCTSASWRRRDSQPGAHQTHGNPQQRDKSAVPCQHRPIATKAPHAADARTSHAKKGSVPAGSNKLGPRGMRRGGPEDVGASGRPRNAAAKYTHPWRAPRLNTPDNMQDASKRGTMCLQYSMRTRTAR